jgi:hypothetical protein
LNNVWQPGWDDVAFDVSLRAIPQPINDFESASIDSVNLSKEGALTLRLSATGASRWQVESSIDAGDIYSWAPVQEVTFDSAGSISVNASIESGGSNPGLARARFYRLVRTD